MSKSLSKNRVVASLLLLVMLFTNVFEVSYAINEARVEAGTVEVSTWEDFKAAYNDQTINRIELKADIFNSSDRRNLNNRTESLTIYGDRNDGHENPYYILDLGNNMMLELGNSRNFEKYLKLENIIIANATGRDSATLGKFINVASDNGANGSWRLIFKNIKNQKSKFVTDDREMIRLAVARSSRFEFEGDIDIKTNIEVGLPGQVLIKEGTNFKLRQINNQAGYQYSVFWYHTSSGLARDERTFVVEDNVKIDWGRPRTAAFPPVYQYYSSMTIGDNVEWKQDNYLHFISNQGNTGSAKEIKFGNRNIIEATRSSQQSIDFRGNGEGDVEFGPGSKLLIKGEGNIIEVNENTNVRFRNPVGLDLESTGGNIFSISNGGSVDFQYVTMNVWTNPTESNRDDPEASFRKVKSSDMTRSGSGYVTVTSDNQKLVDWYSKANPKRLTTERVPVGKVGVNYINHKTGKKVGEYIIADLHTEFGHTGDYQFLVDEELPLTKNIRETKLPENYRFATEDDLKVTGKKQAKFVKTGMKKQFDEEDIEDPRITDLYVHPEDVKFKVDYVYVDDNKTVRSLDFEEEMGKEIDLSKSPYVDRIYKGFRYAEDNELKAGQKQDKIVDVKGDKTYKTYIVSETEKGGIWGRVLDSEDKKPIANAVIELPGIRRTAQTDENGFYLLPNLDSNIYTTIVSHDKYNSGADSIDVKSSMVYKDFYLDKNAANGGKEDKYLITGLVETVDESGTHFATGASIKVDGYDDKDITVDSYGIYAIANIEGNKEYSIEASKEGFSSSRKPIKLINKDGKLDFKLFSGYSIQIVGKSGDTELYRYSLQTSKTAGKFNVEALNVKGYKVIGNNHGKSDYSKVEIDPTSYDKNKDLIFEYKYNMLDVDVEAIYVHDGEEVTIGNFKAKAEIGDSYKWEGTTPMINGYIFNSMGENIIVKEKDNIFKLYYIKSSGNLKINAMEKLDDGTLKLIGSINQEIKEGETYQVSDTLAPKDKDISDLSYYTLEFGHYIGNPGITSFTYDGRGIIPEVNYIYKRKTSIIKVDAYDIKDNKKLVNTSSLTVRKGENIEVLAPKLEGEIKVSDDLIGDEKQTVFFRHNEDEKTVSFYYKQQKKEMVNVLVELVSVDNKPIISYKVPGETDKELSVSAPSLEGWKISGQETKDKTIIPKISQENKVQFKYEKDVYYIDLKLITKSGEIEKDLTGLLPEGVKTRYEAIRGTNHTIFAPQIPGYSIVNVDETYKEVKNIQKNESIKFIYKPISEILEDFTVDIKVVGKDTQENILYEYTINRPINSGEYTVSAFTQYGYEVDKKEEKLIVKDIPLTVEFKYQSLGQKVYIKAETEDGSEITEYKTEVIDATKGHPFSANAPYIEGWNLVGSSTQSIDSVGEGKDTIIFKYKKIEGNVTIILREEAREGEKEGRIIKRETDNITVSEGTKTINAPDLKGDYYELVGPKEIKIDYKVNQTIEFTYKKEVRKLDIVLYNISDKENETYIKAIITDKEYRIGEVAVITAPIESGYRVLGDSIKLLIVGKDRKPVESEIGDVRFDYKSLGKSDITIIAKEVKGTDNVIGEIQRITLSAQEGMQVDVNAPEFETHKLLDSELKTKVVKAGETVEFQYSKDTAEVRVIAKDVDDKEIEIPVGTKSIFEAVKNKDFTVYAPYIPGYVLDDESKDSVKFSKISGNEIAEFVYQNISEIVDDYTVDVNVKGIDELGNELYSYRINRPKNSKEYSVNAFSQSGYELIGDNSKEIIIMDKDISVEFIYKSLDELVKIKAVDVDNNPISDFTEIKVLGQKGSPFSYNAPYIKGWNLVGKSTQNIESLSETENTISFKYEKAEGNILVIAKEEDGRVIKTSSVQGKVGDDISVVAPDLKGEHYRLITDSPKIVKYTDYTQEIEFIYKKIEGDISLELVDITDPSNEKKETRILEGKYRLGETAEITAPSRENLYLLGDAKKLVLVDSENIKVRFEYKSTMKDQIVIEAIDSENGSLLQSTYVTVDEGTSLKVNAPSFDTHKLAEGEKDVVTAKAGTKVVFKYDKNTVEVTVKAKDLKANDIKIPAGNKTKFEAIKNKDYTVYAPHIPGYVIKEGSSDKLSFKKIDKNEDAIFIYQPISEVVDDYTVDVSVKGVDELGNELYSYRINRPKNSGDYSVNAFTQSGYELIGDSAKKVLVEDKDINLVFKYKSLEELVTIRAVDVYDNLIPGFREIKVIGQKGSPFSYNAPHIEGWNLIGDSSQNIGSVSETKNTISFKYEKAEGNILVVAKEENGRVIKTSSVQGKVGDEITVNAPDLKADHYILKTESPKLVKYTGELQEVVFEYSKSKGKISLELVDITDPDKEIVKTVNLEGDYRLGETAEVMAPSQDNLYLVGDAKKLVLVDKGDIKVRFEYKSTMKDQITIEAIDSESGLVLQSTYVTVDEGTSLKVNAPSFDTHKLAEGEKETVTAKAGSKLVFKYDKNTVKVKIKAKDSKGKNIDTPIGTKTEFEAIKNKDYTVYAPHIAGYVIKEDKNASIKYNKIDGDKEAEFIYQPISEVVDDYTVEIEVKAIDELNNKIYSYNITRPKNSGKYIVNAFNQYGYSIEEEDMVKELDVKDKGLSVVFKYQSLGQKVYIKAESEDGSEIDGYNTEVKDATKGQPFSANAPYIKGWNLVGSSIQTIDSVDEGNNIIVFKYKKIEGNVTIILREDNEKGRIIKRETDNITVSEGSKTINAPDLKDDYYQILGSDKIDIEYKDTQTIEFIYKKQTRKIKIGLYNVSDKENEEFLNHIETDELYRIGEVATIAAPDKAGFSLVGDNVKLIVLEGMKIPENTEDVRFDYKSLGEKTIKIIAKEIGGGNEEGIEIQTIELIAQEGIKVNVKAPSFETHKLASGQEDTVTAMAGDEVVFKYNRNTVSVDLLAKDSKDNKIDFEAGTKTKFEAVKNKDYTVYAPHIPGYVVSGIKEKTIENISENKIVEFIYQAISEVVDDYTVDVNVKGIDESGSQLYSYRVNRPKNSDYNVKAFTQSGYELIGDDFAKGDIEDSDIDVVFKYKSLDQVVTIRGIDRTGKPLPNYSDIKVVAQIGSPFSYNAPHVRGWNLVGDLTQTIDKVSESNNLMTFEYDLAEGNVEVILREDDKNGRIIKTESKGVVINQSIMVKAPNLEDQFYEQVGKTEELVAYSEEKQTVEFFYKKMTREVELELYDLVKDEVISLTSKGNFRIGEVFEFKAPALENRYVVGSIDKLESIKKGTGSQKVRFDYRSTDEEEIVVNAIDKNTRELLQSTTVSVEKGNTMKINAPIFDSHKLSEDELETKLAKSGETVVFEYDNNTVKVTLEAKDSGANDIEIPVGIQKEFEAIKNKDFTAYAPHIPGYVIEDENRSSIKLNKVDRDTSVRFIYIPLSEVIDEYTADVNVKGVDELGNELYFYRVSRPNNSKYTASAFNQSGYKLLDSRTKDINIGVKDINVEFKYKSLEELITIKAVDKDGNKIEDYTEIKVLGQSDSPFSYNAPHIEGWNLLGSSTQKIDKVSETENIITFKYEKAEGNILVVAKEKDGRVIKTSSVQGKVGEDITVKAPYLEEEHYNLKTESSKVVKYTDELQEVIFEYEKTRGKIILELVDISDKSNEKLEELELDGEYRLGEMAELVAPSRDGLYLIGDAKKLVLVDSKDTKVRFEYKSTRVDDIVIESIDNKTGLLLQSNYVAIDRGASMKVSAPTFETHKLASGESSRVTAKAGSKVIFRYDENTVKVKIVALDSEGNTLDLEVGSKEEFRAVRNKDYTVYAPHIPGYVIKDKNNSKIKYNKIDSDKTAEFIYKSISEVVDDYTVDVNVKGVDELGNELYSYRVNRPKNSGDYSVNAFKLSGYELTGNDLIKETVKDKDINLVFKYKSLEELVTIKAVDKDNKSIPDFREIKVVGQIGSPFSYNAPHIEGWNLLGKSRECIDKLSNTKNVITFKYEKAEGNILVVAKEEDGRVIKTSSLQGKIGEDITVNAPDLKDDYYVLKTESPKLVKYTGELQEVEFEYSKSKGKISLELVDITDPDKEIVKIVNLEGDYRLGEIAEVTAPSQDNLYLIGDAKKLVLVDKADIKVRFEYKSSGKDQIVIEAVDSKTGLLLQSTYVTVDEGSSMKVSAPSFETHKLADGEEETVTAKAGSKIVFKYDDNTVKVTVKAKDSKGKDVNIPVGTRTEFDAIKNKDYTVYAPHIAGYVIKEDKNASIKYNKINGDKEAEFIYQSISEVVDDYTVDVNVKGVDELGNELYSYRVNRPKNSNYSVNAFKQSGYELIGEDKLSGKLENKDINLVFKYKSLEELVTIKAVDKDNKAIPDFREIKVVGQIGSPFSYNAPNIEGWNLVGASTESIDKLSTSKNVITFKYEKAEGNILVVAREKDGRVIKTSSLQGKVGEDITVTAPELRHENYTLDTESPKVVKYTNELQEVVFEYSKSKGKITLELVDTTDGEKVELKELDGEFRLGEVVEVVAPSRDNLYLVGDAKKLVLVDKADIKVRFEYKSSGKDQIAIEAVDSKTGLVLQSTYVTVDEGSSMKVSAPIFETHKLADGEKETVTAKAGSKIVFKYDDNTVKVTVKAKDSKGKDVNIPVGTRIEFDAIKNKDYTVYAPHIAGYVIKEDKNASIKYNKIDGDKEAEFIYQPISEVVDDYTVDINVRGIVKENLGEEKELYNYTVTRAKNSGEYIVDAFAHEGYVLSKGENGEDLSQRILDIAEEDIQVVFIYELGKTNVTIRLINDETGEEITEDIHEEKLDPIILEATKGQALTYNAPYIIGYNLIKGSNTIGKIENVTDTDNIIEFRYKLAQGNILVLLREKSSIAEEDGRIIKSSSIIGSEGDIITVTAEDLSLDYYNSLGYGGRYDGTEDPVNQIGEEEIEVRYTETQQIFVFDYEKRKTNIDLKYNDMYNGELLEVVDAKDNNLYRLGEVYTFNAPERENRKILVDDKKNIIIREPENNELQLVSFDYKVLDLSDVVIKYVDNAGNELDRILVKNKKIGEEYTHIYAKSVTDKNGDVLDIVKFESDKLKVAENVSNNIMIFIYSKEIKEEPKPPTPPTPEPERPIIVMPPENIKYTVKHIYKDDKGKSIDIIKPITTSVKQGEKVKVAASKNIDSKKYTLISDPVIELEVGTTSTTVVFEYRNNDMVNEENINNKDHFQYIEGYKDGTVRPNANITREEAATIVYRILDEEFRKTIKKETHNFKDVAQSRWSRKYIGTLENGKIIEGYEDGTFRATNNITRAEAITMLTRLYDKNPTGTNTFKDVRGHWAEQAIGSAVEKGIVQGYEDGTFRPDKKITRAEFVTMVNNLLGRKVKEENMLNGRKEFKDLEKGQWYYTDMQEAVNGHEYEMLEKNIEKWTKLRTFDIDF